MSNHVSKELETLLERSGAFDRSESYVYFDRVWHNPEELEKCAKLVSQYIGDILEMPESRFPSDRSRIVILSPDSVRSNFGIIPITVLVAVNLGCRIAIWKEFADIRWGTSSIMGSTEITGLTCIVLQDVVSRGNTALRMSKEIKELGWDFRVYIGVVLNNEEEDVPAQNTIEQIGKTLGYRPDLRYIVSARNLR